MLNSPAGKSYLPGLRDGRLGLEGLYDGNDQTADSIDKILAAALGGQPVLTYLPVGDTFGSYGQGFQAVQTAYDVLTPGQALSKVTASFQSKTGWERGLIAHALANRSASGNGTTLDNTLPTGNGFAAYLQVSAVTGTGGTVGIYHSADNVTYVELQSFTASTAIGAQRIAVTGTVLRYVRAQYTINGASSLTFQVLFCRK